MIDRATKLRLRRRFRKTRSQVGGISVTTEEQIERHFFRRINRLIEVKRFIFSWLALVILLGGVLVYQMRSLVNSYQTIQPAAGGTYTEGIIGTFTNANPLYATGAVDSSVSRLIFSGLMKYDADNQLVPDLAEKIESDTRGLRYTVTLRQGVAWHDGKPFTAEDVLYTYQTIQNADAKSPLFTSWQGIKFESPNPQTVVFVLPSVLSSFPLALTNGIVPAHKLRNIPIGQLRSNSFNTAAPIGTGPFVLKTIEVEGNTPETRHELVGLSRNEKYHLGAAKINRFVIRSFRTEAAMLASFERRELDGMVGLDTIPDKLLQNAEIVEYNIPLTGQVDVFFKTTNPILSDIKVRQALTRGVETDEIVNGLGYPVIASRSPLLVDHIGYDKALIQADTNIEEANKLLDESGWKMGEDGYRYKESKQLSFQLYAQSNSDNIFVTRVLQQQWRNIGVYADVQLRSEDDLQSVLAFHNYDALVYGISLGNDPDVFPYWHSSQADVSSAVRLNFSEYRSPAADSALESGRTRADNALRAVKYRPFLEAWRNDAPAIALYQPRFLYVAEQNIAGFKPRTINTAADRFNSVHEWLVREVKSDK